MKLKQKARLKLAKMLNIKFESVETETVELLYDGELVIGSEVFIEVEGELSIPENGEYKVNDTLLVVEDGIVIDIKVTEEVVEEPVQVEEEFEEDVQEETKSALEERVDELEGQIKLLVEIIKEITGAVDEVKEEVVEVVEDVEAIDVEFKKALGKTVKQPIKKSTIKQSKDTSLTDRFFG